MIFWEATKNNFWFEAVFRLMKTSKRDFCLKFEAVFKTSKAANIHKLVSAYFHNFYRIAYWNGLKFIQK